MKRFLMTITLGCVLSGSALAGDIPTGGYTPPPPPPDESQTTTSPGSIPCDVSGAIPSDGFSQQVDGALLDGFLAVIGWLT